MRSRMSCNVSASEIHRWTLNWLLEAKLIGDHGWLCTASLLFNLVLRAAARTTSISATSCGQKTRPTINCQLYLSLAALWTVGFQPNE